MGEMSVERLNERINKLRDALVLIAEGEDDPHIIARDALDDDDKASTP